jgi:hypothetical protein
MTELESLTRQIEERFAAYPRPVDYIDQDHCDECAEHYQTLLDVAPADLTKDHVGDGAWDPSCFLTADAFRHYFPGLARIAVADRGWLAMLAPRFGLWYVDSFDTGDRRLTRRWLEALWLDPGTDERQREDIELALSYFQHD